MLREEGSNGDRELGAAFYLTGKFEPVDVTMTDLINGTVTLDSFRGLACSGGFSFADCLGSAKGWSGGSDRAGFAWVDPFARLGNATWLRL